MLVVWSCVGSDTLLCCSLPPVFLYTILFSRYLSIYPLSSTLLQSCVVGGLQVLEQSIGLLTLKRMAMIFVLSYQIACINYCYNWIRLEMSLREIFRSNHSPKNTLMLPWVKEFQRKIRIFHCGGQGIVYLCKQIGTLYSLSKQLIG